MLHSVRGPDTTNVFTYYTTMGCIIAYKKLAAVQKPQSVVPIVQYLIPVIQIASSARLVLFYASFAGMIATLCPHFDAE